MNAFAEGICNRDWSQATAARKAIAEALGEAALVDAAAVIASFNAYRALPTRPAFRSKKESWKQP